MKNTGTLKVECINDCDVVMTRVFDAPREMVYAAFSKPELLKRWFGPHGWSLDTCEVDHKVGGGFRFILVGPEGHRMGMRGTYVELAPPHRSVHRETFDDYPGESTVSAVFTEKNGKTTMVATVTYGSKEIRDAVIASGMEHGAAESYDRLAGLLEEAEEISH